MNESRLLTRIYAEGMWKSFTPDEKALVRYGMFPMDRMKKAELDGYEGKDLAVGLMDCAAKDGGMIA